MIFKGTAPRALSWSALGALVVSAAILLPIRPTWGQDRSSSSADEEKPAAPTSAPSITIAAQPAATAPGTKLSGTTDSSSSQIGPTLSGFPQDVEEAKDAVELLRVQLEGKEAELLEARALVHQTRRQFERQDQLRKRGVVSEEEVDSLRTELAVREARLRAKEAQVKEGQVRLNQAVRRLSRLQSSTERRSTAGSDSSSGTPLAPSVKPAARGSSSGVADTPGLGSTSGKLGATRVRVPTDDTGSTGIQRSATPDGEQRMRDLEMKLDKLLKEVAALRREIRRQQPSGGGSNVPGEENIKPSAAISR